MTRPREHVRYVIVTNAVGNFCYGYLRSTRESAKQYKEYQFRRCVAVGEC